MLFLSDTFFHMVMTMTNDDVAQETVRLNAALIRCLRYLGDELPESKRGDYLVLLNDLQSKSSQLSNIAAPDTAEVLAVGTKRSLFKRDLNQTSN